MNQSEHIIDTQRDSSLVTVAHVVYALHLLSLGACFAGWIRQGPMQSP